MKKLFFLWAIVLLTACDEKHSEQTPETTEKNKEFLFTNRQVGAITNGTTVDDLYELYGKDKVKKVEILTNPAINKTEESYYILDQGNKVILDATPKEDQLKRARINRISIKDKRFVSDKGIGLNSSLDEIKEAYPTYQFLPSSENIIMYIPDLNANFTLNKKTLGHKQWWDTTTNTIVADSLSGKARISDIDVYWDDYEGSIFSGGFWREQLHNILNWTIREVPSILILTAIFIGLMRLLVAITGRMKKVVMRRAEKAKDIDLQETSKRINTLSGIIFGIGRIMLWVIFLLILLSKFNINIAPILASAGIVGLAVGFGAQELVRDFISGFFILLEDQLRTGDWAIINGTTGLVEKIELRTITLRDSSGVVHIFQNGKINSLSNMTKEWSAIVIDVGVAYKEDIDRVQEVMQQVGDRMLADEQYADKILEPVEVQGVTELADSAVIIRVRIKTRPVQQWYIGREYRRLIKKAFDERNIEIPFPHISLYWGEASKDFKVKLDR